MALTAKRVAPFRPELKAPFPGIRTRKESGEKYHDFLRLAHLYLFHSCWSQVTRSASKGADMKDSLLDIRALSTRLCIPIGSIRNALWRGQAGETIPPPIRLGRRLRWREADVEHFLDNRCVPTAPTRPAAFSHTTRGRPRKRVQLARTRQTAHATDISAVLLRANSPVSPERCEPAEPLASDEPTP